MIKYLSLILVLVACRAFAVDSSTVLNTTNGTVFNISYDSGPATVTVVGAISASSISGAVTPSDLTVTGNTILGNGSNDTVIVAGNITASNTLAVGRTFSAAGATLGEATIQTNATVGGTLGVTGIPTFAATSVVFSAAAAAVPTNVVVADGVGLRVRINQTNYFIRATLN